MSTTSAPQTRRRIAGGSQAEDHADNANSNIINIVRPGVEWLIPSDKKVGLAIRIKPALDTRLEPTDPNFPLSWRPYRDRGTQDEKSGLPAFTEWFSMPRVYRYFGNTGLHFVSPTSRPEGMGFSEADRADPLNHIRSFCKKPGNNQWAYLIDKPEKNDKDENGKFAKATVGWPESIALYNVWYVHQDETTPVDAVTFVTTGGHKHVKDQMDAQRPAAIDQNSPLFDPAWPEFLLGDPTDPNRGYWANFRKYQVGNGGAKPWCPLWSSRPGHLDPTGLRGAPLTVEAMKKRWDITSEDVLWIESYQRLVEIIINDGAIPREVVAQACGHMCSIPGNGAPQQTYAAAATGGMFAPPTHAEDQIPGLAPAALGMTAPFGTPVGAEQFPAAGQQFPSPAGQGFAPQQAQQPFGAPAPQSFGAPAPAPQSFGAPAPAPQPFGAPAAAAFPQQAGAPFQPLGAPPAGQAFGAPAPAPQPFGGQPQGAPPVGHTFAPQGAPASQPFGAPAGPQGGFAPQPAASPLGGHAMPSAAPGNAPFSPPAGAPPAFASAPPPPPPPPAPQAEKFWVVIGGAPQPAPMTLAEAQQNGATHVAAQSGPTAGNWRPIGELVQAAPAPAPQAFQQPQQAAAPTEGPLSAAESAELDALFQRAGQPDTAKQMVDDEIKRLGALQLRKQRYGVAQ